MDVVGAGRGVRSNGRRVVQGSLLLSAENLDITGGGIIAPTQGDRIGSRIELQAEPVDHPPWDRTGRDSNRRPRILDADGSDPGGDLRQ